MAIVSASPFPHFIFVGQGRGRSEGEIDGENQGDKGPKSGFVFSMLPVSF